MALPTTLGRPGFPTVTRMFRRRNACHRINGWDGTPEAWTRVRRGRGGLRATARCLRVRQWIVAPAAT